MIERTDTERRYWLESQDNITLFGGKRVQPRWVLEVGGESYRGRDLGAVIDLAMESEKGNS